MESYLTEDDLESEKKNTKKREKNAKKRNILVCTSNFKPKQLYKGGLNWKSLLVSEVLSERLDAVSLDGEEHESPEKFRDYRKASFAAEEASARETEGETSSLSSSSMIFGDDADASLRLHWEKLMLSSKNRSKRHHHALSDRLEKIYKVRRRASRRTRKRRTLISPLCVARTRNGLREITRIFLKRTNLCFWNHTGIRRRHSR